MKNGVAIGVARALSQGVARNRVSVRTRYPDSIIRPFGSQTQTQTRRSLSSIATASSASIMQNNRQGNFLAEFYKSHPVSQESIDHFRLQPWLHSYLDDPSYEKVPIFFRLLKDSGEDYFFSRTLATPTTIPHILCLNHRAISTPPEVPAGTPLSEANEAHSSSTSISIQTQGHAQIQVPDKPDCIFLISLASPGIDGHPHICHGGVLASILDEAIGLVTMLHTQKPAPSERDSLFTVNLNVTYRAPVTTPRDVVLRCWLKARQGRKWVAVGQFVDQDGLVLCEAQGMYVVTKKKRESL